MIFPNTFIPDHSARFGVEIGTIRHTNCTLESAFIIEKITTLWSTAD